MSRTLCSPRLADERLWPVPSLDAGARLGGGCAVRRARCGCDARYLIGRSGQPGRGNLPSSRRHSIGIELAASRMQSMTVTEVRIGSTTASGCWSGRGGGRERHQTLHHAVQWFAGGFDLPAACAVGDSTDEFTTIGEIAATPSTRAAYPRSTPRSLTCVKCSGARSCSAERANARPGPIR